MDSAYTLLKILASLVVAYLAPIHGVMLATFLLIMIDLVTGLLAAFKRKKKITSSALSRTISKLSVYQTSVISGYLCEKLVFGAGLQVPIASLVGTFIGIVEFKSILENLDKIHGSSVLKGLITRLSNEYSKNQE